MGRTILTKHLEVSTPNGTRMCCRICSLELYLAPPPNVLDIEQMNDLLKHFLIQHEIDREDLAKEMKEVFDREMRKQDRESIDR